MFKISQRGFSQIILLVIVLIAIILVGKVAYDDIYNNPPLPSTRTSGAN